MGEKPQLLTGEMVDAVARRFRLLGEPLRLRLLQILESGERSVNELAHAVSGTQANVSRHLTALHEGGFVNRRRDASNVYYSIADPVVFKLCDLVCHSTRKYVRQRLGKIQ